MATKTRLSRAKPQNGDVNVWGALWITPPEAILVAARSLRHDTGMPLALAILGGVLYADEPGQEWRDRIEEALQTLAEAATHAYERHVPSETQVD